MNAEMAVCRTTVACSRCEVESFETGCAGIARTVYAVGSRTGCAHIAVGIFHDGADAGLSVELEGRRAG